MKILHTVNSIGKGSYGLSSISLGLAKAQLEQGNDVYIWSSDTQEDLNWAADIYKFPIERLLGYPSSFPIVNVSLSELYNAFNEKKIDVVHQHSLWTSQSLVTSLLRKNGAKTCIAPHGTLSEFALNKSKLKKKIALSVFEKGHLQNSNSLHATSEYEIEDFRRLGLKNPIAYIENGTDDRHLNVIGDGLYFRNKYNIPFEKKVLLYLSRITPKKGLDMLLRAIGSIKSDFSNWVLVIVGNDEFNYKSKLETMVFDLGIRDKVFFIEPQYGNNKFNAFEAADFFVLPSYSEGSPMVVVDALAYGLPVITTHSSSWSDLNTFKCGYWVEISDSSIKNALNSMVNLKDEQLMEFRSNAKGLVREKFLWSEIAKKSIKMYDWLYTQKQKPDFIY